MLREDTITAISTPPGEGAIAVVRITGPEALSIAERVFRSRKPFGELRPRVLYHGEIHDGDNRVDHGLLAIFRAPASYTGEAMAELHCHGGILVAARVLETVLTAGARAAEPGEFTQRAFLNGKLDLTQAEAVMDVIRARTPLALRAAGEQLAGRLGQEIEALRARILQIVAHVEAYIDFPEEGIDPQTGQSLVTEIRACAVQVDVLLATAHEGRILREGVRLVLCGAPNAGKSSLLNRLLGFERAIVSDTPGTTRDTIEELASLHGIPFRITDTAGLRETEDLVEREGVERAQRAVAGADVVVRVIDISSSDFPQPQEGEIIALNKSDMPCEAPQISGQAFRISCVTGDGLDELVNAIVRHVKGGEHAAAPSLAAINARHQSCLARAREALEHAAVELEKGTSPEYAATHLHAALEAVGEVVGAADTEEILGKIFSSFCIGK